MKLYFTVALIFLSVGVFSFVQAAPDHRQKRAVSLEECPENTTEEQCLNYATEQSKNLNYCHRFLLHGGSLEWQSCGSVTCGENTRLVAEDLSKPYPQCCKTCEIIDPSKPAEMSST